MNYAWRYGLCMLIVGASQVARADLSPDTCAMFTRDVSAALIGKFSTEIANAGVAIRLCGNGTNISRAFLRAQAIRVTGTPVCEVVETALHLGLIAAPTSGGDSSVENENGVRRMYFAWDKGQCPGSASDRYVLVDGVDARTFQLVWAWWSGILSSPQRNALIISRIKTSNDQVMLRNAFADGKVLLRSIRERGLDERTLRRIKSNEQYVATVSIGSGVETLFDILLTVKSAEVTPGAVYVSPF